MIPLSLNFRSLDALLPKGQEHLRGMFFRSGKLSILSPQACRRLISRYGIRCVIDLRTPVEAAEFPDDALDPSVNYVQIPLIKDATIGISHETGSDPMTILRNLRRDPERLRQLIPDFEQLYRDTLLGPYGRTQLDKALALLHHNAAHGIPTLMHCTAGKDRTGILTMALLKGMGVSREDVVREFMLTNHSTLLPTLRKCIGVWLLTRRWQFVSIAYHALMADERLIRMAYDEYIPKDDKNATCKLPKVYV